MCNFFSITSDGKGNILYFDSEIRKKILLGELDYEADSHASINRYYGFKEADENSRNKYEFNPLTGNFIIVRINSLDDSKEVAKKVQALDFSTIVPELIIKPIVHPFRIETNDVTDADICNLHKWNSVWDSFSDSFRNLFGDSFGASVGDSVWASVGASFGVSFGALVWDSVWDSVGDSVVASVGDSVVASVGDSAVASVGDSAVASGWAYISSFFKLEKWKYIDHDPFVNPYQCLIDLWERGFVPSFDGKTWRLHSGVNAEVVYSEDAE